MSSLKALPVLGESLVNLHQIPKTRSPQRRDGERVHPSFLFCSSSRSRQRTSSGSRFLPLTPSFPSHLSSAPPPPRRPVLVDPWAALGAKLQSSLLWIDSGLQLLKVSPPRSFSFPFLFLFSSQAPVQNFPLTEPPRKTILMEAGGGKEGESLKPLFPVDAPLCLDSPDSHWALIPLVSGIFSDCIVLAFPRTSQWFHENGTSGWEKKGIFPRGAGEGGRGRSGKQGLGYYYSRFPPFVQPTTSPKLQRGQELSHHKRFPTFDISLSTCCTGNRAGSSESKSIPDPNDKPTGLSPVPSPWPLCPKRHRGSVGAWEGARKKKRAGEPPLRIWAALAQPHLHESLPHTTALAAFFHAPFSCQESWPATFPQTRAARGGGGNRVIKVPPVIATHSTQRGEEGGERERAARQRGVLQSSCHATALEKGAFPATNEKGSSSSPYEEEEEEPPFAWLDGWETRGRKQYNCWSANEKWMPHSPPPPLSQAKQRRG